MLTRDPWWRQWADRGFYWLLRGARLRSGPVAFECRGAVYFLSWSGRLFRVTDDGGDYLVVHLIDRL